jgi:hypothetical protein
VLYGVNLLFVWSDFEDLDYFILDLLSAGQCWLWMDLQHTAQLSVISLAKSAWHFMVSKIWSV